MQFSPKKILCTIDLSAASREVMRWAGLFARTFRARVVVLYADWWEVPRYFTQAQVDALKTQAEKHKSALHDQLVQLCRDILGPEIAHNLAIVEGHPVQAILEHAARNETDLIVMGSHGRSGIARLRLGSIAENVSRESSCPVLIVKAPAT